MTLNELVQAAHQIAKDHGWHEKPTDPLVAHALIHAEVSEATEEVRSNHPPVYKKHQDLKPMGEAVELADAVIRIADYFGTRGWDLENVVSEKMNYNRMRPYRHGNKIY